MIYKIQHLGIRTNDYTKIANKAKTRASIETVWLNTLMRELRNIKNEMQNL